MHTLTEQLVQCCRCRNKHKEGDRVDGKTNGLGMTPQVCPKCGGHSYYRLDENGKPVRG